MPQLSDKQQSNQRIAAASEKYKNQIRELTRSYPWDENRRASFKPKAFGDKVSALRNQSGQSQAYYAKSTGMSVAMFSKIERGEIKELNPRYLYLLSVVFDCNPDYLLGRTNLPNGLCSAKPDGTTEELYCPIKFTEPPIAKLDIVLMDQVLHLAAQEAYDRIPESVFQLIAILESTNEKLHQEFSAELNHLCKKYDLAVDHFDGNDPVEHC